MLLILCVENSLQQQNITCHFITVNGSATGKIMFCIIVIFTIRKPPFPSFPATPQTNKRFNPQLHSQHETPNLLN